MVLGAALLTAALVLSPGTWGPTGPDNPNAGPTGTNTMHGDMGSSDTTPIAGSGTSAVLATYLPEAAACPTITIGKDGLLVALCTAIADRKPYVRLLDPTTGATLAQYAVPASNLFGGAYSYLDDQDRMVLVDGDDDLLRIAHSRTTSGTWQLTASDPVPLGAAFTQACGSATCDTVVGIAADWSGHTWIATTGGLTGTVDIATGAVHLLRLGTGEHVDNTISTIPGHTAVATDHALYLLHAATDGTPVVDWTHPYDRGTARKPGQLSRGTGTTPAFFGPVTGTEYVAITDNAEPHEDLLVFRVGSSTPICTVPVLTRLAVSGTEDAVIGSGRSVIVNDTYGYPYPAVPDDAGTAVPATAPFVGGLTRVDVDADGTGCSTVWDSDVRSAALPRLSIADGLIYTVTSAPGPLSPSSNASDTYSYAVLDAATGKVVASQLLGATTVFDALQLTGTTGADHVFWQGTITGIVRIQPLTEPTAVAPARPSPSASSRSAVTPAGRSRHRSPQVARAPGSLAATGGSPLLPLGATLLVAASLRWRRAGRR